MDRRHFLKASALVGGGLLLQFTGLLTGNAVQAKALASNAPAAVPVNAFLRIGPDNQILFRVTRHEMGQGVATGMAMILAEELDTDWEKVKLEFGPADLDLYKDKGGHGTGGSTTIVSMWQVLRTMGASARHLLVQAAAAEWQVDVKQVSTQKGVLVNRQTGARLTYSDVAGKASGFTVPENVHLKNSADYTLIGKGLANKIIPDVVRGTHPYAWMWKCPECSTP